MVAQLSPYLRPGTEALEQEHYLEIPLKSPPEGLPANAYYLATDHDPQRLGL